MTCLPHWGPELPALASPRGSESGHLSLPATWLSLALWSVHTAPVSRPQSLRGRRGCGRCGSCSWHLLGTLARDDTPGTELGGGGRGARPNPCRAQASPASVPIGCILRATHRATQEGVILLDHWDSRHLLCICCTGHPLCSLRVLQMRSLGPREVPTGS